GNDTTAAESWAYLYVPCEATPQAWEHILKRAPRCVEWSEAEVMALVGEEKFSQTMDVIRRISTPELMRFKVGRDGLGLRPPQSGGSAVAILGGTDAGPALAVGGFCRQQLEATRRAGGRIGLICLAQPPALETVRAAVRDDWAADCLVVLVPAPEGRLLLDGAARVGLKLLLNALSTCTMVRLGRVMGNFMIWVVASNLKLIDRATRYIQRLTGLEYTDANRLLFEVVEYVEPRCKADKAYPPVVGLAVMRQRHGLTNEQAEERLMAELG
ncbi:MAG TPA: hypothetical protein PKK20_12555, partial [Verrucomicrobiota bacterium]|nr:hypothetical protein [Verrucomicrobiota bacterium]